MTPTIASWFQYLHWANVPTVSFTCIRRQSSLNPNWLWNLKPSNPVMNVSDFHISPKATDFISRTEQKPAWPLSMNLQNQKVRTKHTTFAFSEPISARAVCSCSTTSAPTCNGAKPKRSGLMFSDGEEWQLEMVIVHWATPSYSKSVIWRSKLQLNLTTYRISDLETFCPGNDHALVHFRLINRKREREAYVTLLIEVQTLEPKSCFFRYKVDNGLGKEVKKSLQSHIPNKIIPVWKKDTAVWKKI